jgi:hypothetical protein
VLPPKDFLRRLIATIPPKGMNVVRFHGVFAPRATARPALQALLPKQPPHKPDDRITGGPSTSQPAAVAQLPAVESSVASSEDLPPPRYRRPWHELLKRVFDLDLVCGRCGARMHHISHIDDPQVIDKILGHLGLPTQMPRRAPARALPQEAFDLADVDEPEVDDLPVFYVD